MLEVIQDRFKRSKNIAVVEVDGNYIINIDRKSRFIMKDSKNLIGKLDGIDLKRVKLKLTGDICGKSILYLGENGVEVVEANNL